MAASLQLSSNCRMAVNILSSPSMRVGHASPGSTPIHVVTQDPADRFYDLATDEEKWRDRYLFLPSCGLELRPRYRPGWIPSWRSTNLLPEDCEDSKIKTVSSSCHRLSCSTDALHSSFIPFWTLRDARMVPPFA